MTTTAARGFAAAAATAGLKASGTPDLALVRNLGPRFDAAAVFTANRVKAAPVQWSERVVADGTLRAVVLNSGGANACTGADGFADTHRTAEAVADELDIGAIDVAVCSTGLIGVRLQIDNLLDAVPGLVATLDPAHGTAAAEAIMTTDTVAKTAVVHGDGWTVGGMAKGAGMLAPGLATMLVVLTTDAVADASVLDGALREASRMTFDRTDSDGCMSTNDTVVLMSSGASGVTPTAARLTTAVTELCADLARQLIGDAEGAAHDITVTVTNAETEDQAVTVARAVARSNLFKCAVFGQDPNWGRVLSAVGTTDATYHPDQLDVMFNGVQVCRSGGIGDPREGVDLSGRQVEVVIDLHAGSETATVLTNDLTYDYVKENAEYST